MNPYFMDMYFEIKQPQIILKAEKKSTHFYELNFQKIKVENRDFKSEKRFKDCNFREANAYIYE